MDENYGEDETGPNEQEGDDTGEEERQRSRINVSVKRSVSLRWPLVSVYRTMVDDEQDVSQGDSDSLR